ncbi:hypothetical protein A3770_09p56150 [Chloropicon primus]|uniref:Uncharacterized protein n=1 Tax=Chloropicon primus TaxID=1764295 RepID=A0A5B8MS44_9CHLO|nr:hypothetical protein A3770_09p56150 [Chloropicon primus]|eukprot:QDZ23097.1 hypothetical protein A3770_09p56150 [Chloropicon primus]
MTVSSRLPKAPHSCRTCQRHGRRTAKPPERERLLHQRQRSWCSASSSAFSEVSEPSSGRDDGSRGRDVQLARVFWADDVKLEVYSSEVSKETAKVVGGLAAIQEWIIRRDLLLKNVLAHASKVGVLEPELVQGIFAEAERSDAPLFRFVDEQVLARVLVGLVETTGTEGVGSAAAPGGSEGSKRESLLLPVLSWALGSEDIVQPQEFEDMQFSWTFKDQPYVARRAAWRTVVSVDRGRSEGARRRVAASLAHDLNFEEAEAELSLGDAGEDDDAFSGNAMTGMAFGITLEDAERVVLDLDTGSSEDQSVEIGTDHLRVMKTVLLAFFKSRTKAQNWITCEPPLVRIRQADTSSGLAEVVFTSRDGTGEQQVLAKPSDLQCLLDMLDFVGMHEQTLPCLSMQASCDLNEQEIYESGARLRSLKAAAKASVSILTALLLGWVALNRTSERVQSNIRKLEVASGTFTTVFVDKYRSRVEKKGLELSKGSEVLGSSLRKNKSTARTLAALLKTSAEGGSKFIKGRGTAALKYQVVMTRSGNLAGLSPVNVEAIAKWKDVSELLLFKPSAADAGALKVGDAFVFLLTIHEDGKVSTEPWDMGKNMIEVN